MDVLGMFVVVGMTGSLVTRLESLMRGFVSGNGKLDLLVEVGGPAMFVVVGMIGSLERRV